MAAFSEDDWNSEADHDVDEESLLAASRNCSLECDMDVTVKVARSHCTTASKNSGPFMDTPSEKSGLSLDEDSLLDGDLDKDFPAGNDTLLPGLSDVSLPPKQTITTDPLDLSLSEGDDTSGQLLPPPQTLAPILEEPEHEAPPLEMEEPQERKPEELSTHMEEEPAPLKLDTLPFHDAGISADAGNDVLPDSPEPKLQISEQSLAQCAVQPEISDVSLKEDKATSTADIIIEDLPARPKSPYQTRNRPQVSAHTQSSPVFLPEKLAPPPAESRALPPPSSQRNQVGARGKVAPAFVEARGTRSLGSKVAPPVMAKGSVANQFLEKIGQLRGATVLSEGGHDTCALSEDLMSIEGSQKQPQKYKKEEFGELFTKKPLYGAQFAPKAQGKSQAETEAESDDEDSSVNFDHLPIRSRMNIWKRREDRAIRKGLILIPRLGKQGRFPISATAL
ncbi:hypothetical protein HPB50_020519 [Hyalomma asiaticum]|uniref:Uncharacterized protein n=1 Tax=Hyalomma asiaticum TaxID=266040 RepID=A0ACB7TAT1_HYAAI|nr:hypothetical protein HPB50_020519 [Hyalomma asiaticum]